jgi:uncharacterized protein
MTRSVSLTLAAALVCSGAGHPQTIQVSKDNRTIAVTATDQASAPADVATITVGFEIYAPDAATAYRLGSSLSNAILDALRRGGVADKSIESKEQSLMHTEFRENDKSTPDQRAQKQFTLSQSWNVHAAAGDAANILHLAIEAGANESGNIDWDVADHNGLAAKAAEKALVRARAIAAQMASGLNAHLGALIYASNQTPVQRFVAMASAQAVVSAEKAAAPPPPLAIRPQQVEESATVYAVFAIE